MFYHLVQTTLEVTSPTEIQISPNSSLAFNIFFRNDCLVASSSCREWENLSRCYLRLSETTEVKIEKKNEASGRSEVFICDEVYSWLISHYKKRQAWKFDRAKAAGEIYKTKVKTSADEGKNNKKGGTL